MTDRPILIWLRRDLRLHDHPALRFAADRGAPVIPVFIRDELLDSLGAAAKWRLGEALASFAERLEGIGSKLVLRSGRAVEVLEALASETGAGAVTWTRGYDGATVARDLGIKARLKAAGLEARSFPGFLLHEPWEAATGEGAPYKVFTPFWRAVKDRPVADPLPALRKLAPPERWPSGERLADWRMGAAMRRGAAVLARHARVGEAAALRRLDGFLDEGIGGYARRRDLLAQDGTSGLSENLTYGEISPRVIWHGAVRAREAGAPGAEAFLRELGWREFAWHLFYHAPEMGHRNWRAEWDGFAWRPDNADAERWRRGRTGVTLVDAAMREMYVTGRMHNRARMVVASFLTKHLLTHWQVGLTWFEDCLTDWDPASNALGWQWVAGSGPDAAPYFRVFNPDTQAGKFDPAGAYRRRWLAEGDGAPSDEALEFYQAIPRAWGMAPDDPVPDPVVGLKEGRARALAAYEAR